MLRDIAKEYIEVELKYGEPYNPYHYNCAEVMLNAANDFYKLNLDKKSLNMMTPFGGGMFARDACGMLTGGLAVIGIIFTEDKPSDNLKVKEITRFWAEKIKEEFNSTNCKLIMDTNGIAENDSCTHLILKAADILEYIIEHYSND